MGVSDLRDSFNAEAAPGFTCQTATMRYARGADGQETQLITIKGVGPSGDFELVSAPFEGDSDVNEVAKAMAVIHADGIAAAAAQPVKGVLQPMVDVGTVDLTAEQFAALPQDALLALQQKVDTEVTARAQKAAVADVASAVIAAPQETPAP